MTMGIMRKELNVTVKQIEVTDLGRVKVTANSGTYNEEEVSFYWPHPNTEVRPGQKLKLTIESV